MLPSRNGVCAKPSSMAQGGEGGGAESMLVELWQGLIGVQEEVINYKK